jgi:nucleotide-binding universal stress UspA family protein
MSAIKNILVPVDFSKCAGNALNFALEIAFRSGAHVHALHVVYPNDQIGNGVYSGMWLDEYFERRQRDLEKWVGRFQKNEAFKTLKITTSCEMGFPIGVIKTVAQDKHADLIVMGTTGATGLRAVLMGSNAAGVVSAADVPVLAVPEKTDFLKHADYVMATDYGIDLDKHSWKILKEILALQHAGLHILHILNKPGERPDKSAEKQIKRQLEDVACQFHCLHDDNVAKAVGNYLESVGATGMVAISHRHGFLYKLIFQSTSRMLVQRAKTPILVLHDRERK